MVRTLVLASVFTLASMPAWADFAPNASPLPAPGVFGLVAAGIVGALIAARLRK